MYVPKTIYKKALQGRFESMQQSSTTPKVREKLVSLYLASETREKLHTALSIITIPQPCYPVRIELMRLSAVHAAHIHSTG